MAENDPDTPREEAAPPATDQETAQHAENGAAPAPSLDPGKAAEPDWREAYISSQKSNSRLARRYEEQQQTTAALVDALKIVRKQNEAIAKATLPAEQADALIAEGKGLEQEQRQKTLVDQTSRLVNAQHTILKSALTQAGIDPKTIDWADDATSVDEWTERVHASIQKEIGNARNGLLNSVSKAVQVKTKEIEAKSKEETRRALKDAGAEKIDIAQGSPSTFAQQLATMDPNSKEFEKLTEQALAGRLRGIR